MSDIENTSKRDPAMHLLGAMSEGSDDYIEGMEARGQRQVVGSDLLPVDTQGTDAEFEALGFVFGEPAKGDELFRHATLPRGWRRQGSDHSMWSHLVDERGIKRVAIFYKAAFYDRRAAMHIVDVGRDFGANIAYGETVDPEHVARLTDAEREVMVAQLRHYVDEGNDETVGHLYRDQATRASTALAELQA